MQIRQLFFFFSSESILLKSILTANNACIGRAPLAKPIVIL